MAKEFTEIDNHILDVIYEYIEVKNVCSKAELAQHLNVARSTVSAWIKRESIPDANKIPGICNKFGITPNFIFGIKFIWEIFIYLLFVGCKKGRIKGREKSVWRVGCCIELR